ncbi:MAG: hypothetical protein LBC09_00695 [Helicobacteraceae bacterium]|jgi:hypothetical protein|nr:hypothetical protein [Helicobacteraceae bacterium]
MAKTTQTIIVIALLAQSLAAEPRVLKREYIAAPPNAYEKPDDENARVIRRIYRKIDQNDSGAIAPKGGGFFAGASFDYFSRDRKIEVKTNNGGDIVKIGSRYARANGATYSTDERQNEGAANAEIGFLGGETLYYGAKLGLLDDFAEFSVFGGASFKDASFAECVPFLQTAFGVGYEDFEGGIAPDNLSLSVGAGLERAVISDRLSLRLAVFYRYRVWHKLEKRYGDEYWKDGETGASLGFRYIFYQ